MTPEERQALDAGLKPVFTKIKKIAQPYRRVGVAAS